MGRVCYGGTYADAPVRFSKPYPMVMYTFVGFNQTTKNRNEKILKISKKTLDTEKKKKLYFKWCTFLTIDFSKGFFTMKKIFLISTSAVVLTWATPILTNDTDTVVSRSGDVLVDSVNKKGIFQWLEGGFGYTNKKLSYDLTAFKVLRENKSAVRYLQTSLRRKGAENTFNIGFGTRNAIDDARTTLIGANIFIDSKDGAGKFYTFGSKAYKRLSLGLELKTGGFDLSANMYRPMGSAVILGRKVMKGFDMTAKGTVTDTLNIGLNTYKFDGVADKVEQGNKLILEFKPNSIITIRGEYDKPKSSSAQTNVYAGFKFAFGTTNTTPQNSSGTAWAKRYDKVERSYEVKTAEAETIKVFGSPSVSSKQGNNQIRNGDGNSEDTALKLKNNNKYDVKSFISGVPDGITPTVTVERISGTLNVDFAFEKTDGTAITALADVTYNSVLEDKTDANKAILKLTYQLDGYQGKEVYVETAAARTDTLTMADLVVTYGSGNKVVSAEDILAKLKVEGGQTKKADWSIKSLAEKTDVANLAVDGKTLQITDEITSPATITVVFEHPEHADVSKDFKLSTTKGVMSSDGASRYGGKWGKSGFKADYMLKTTDSGVDFDTGASGDFKFEILADSVSVSSYTSTTSGLVSGNLSDAINDKTGVIDGTKLTKKGTLLVKITRAAKGGLLELVGHQNFTVAKQVIGTDINPSAPTVTGAKSWRSGDLDMAYTASTLPGGSTDAASNYAWTVAKKSGAEPDDFSNSKSLGIGSTTGILKDAGSSGTVTITMTANSSNPKYSGAFSFDLNIATRSLDEMTAPTASFASNNNKWQTSTSADLNMTYNNLPSGKSVGDFVWTVKGDTTDGTASIANDADGKIRGPESSGTVTVNMKIRANNDKYYKANTSKDITVAIARRDPSDDLEDNRKSEANAGKMSASGDKRLRAAFKTIFANEPTVWASGKVTAVTIEDNSTGLTRGAIFYVPKSDADPADYALVKTSSAHVDGGDALTKIAAINEIKAGNQVYIVPYTIADRANKYVKITFTFAQTKKYKAGSVATWWKSAQ